MPSVAPSFAAIDVGSNATRILIRAVDGLNATAYSPVLRDGLDISRRCPIPLGYDAYSSGRIGEEKKSQLIEAFTEYAELMRSHNVVRYRAVGTAALRSADNAQDIVNAIAAETGVTLDIIDGNHEAALTRLSYYAQRSDAPRACLFVDVGGGSTDVCLTIDRQAVFSHSFAVGSMRMVCSTQNDSERQELLSTLAHLREVHGAFHVVGAGGSIRKTASLFPDKCIDRCVPLSLLQRLAIEMQGMTLDEKVNHYHISADRARIFHEAVTIYADILTASSATHVEAPDVGVRDGIIVSLIS